jgi:hypothetical protein
VHFQVKEANMRFAAGGSSDLERALSPASGSRPTPETRFSGASADVLDALRQVGLPGLGGALELVVDCPRLSCHGSEDGSVIGFEDVHLRVVSDPDLRPASLHLELAARQSTRPDSLISLVLDGSDVLAPSWKELECNLDVRGVEAKAIGLLSGLGSIAQELFGTLVHRARVSVAGDPGAGATLTASLSSDRLEVMSAEGSWTESRRGANLQLSMAELDSRVIDVLCGSDGWVSACIGDVAHAEVNVSEMEQAGWACRVSLKGLHGELDLAGTWEAGVIRLGEEGIDARFEVGDTARDRLLVPLLPWIQVEESPGSLPSVRWRLSEGRLSVSGDGEVLAGLLVIEAAELEYRYQSQLEKLLMGAEDSPPQRGFGPVRARIEGGSATFEDTPLLFASESGSVAGEVDLGSADVDLEIGVPLASLGQVDPVEAGGEDLGLVTLRMHGSGRDTRLSVDLDALAKLMGEGGESEILGRIQGFLGGLGTLFKR